MRAPRRQMVILSLALVAIAVGLYALAGHLDLRERMNAVVAAVRAAGPVPFFVAMAVLPGLGFPLSAFTLAAGPVFGPTMGIGLVLSCAVLAISFNVAALYWLASRGMRPVAAWVVRRLGYRMPEIQPHAAWLAIVLLRTVPVTPFFLQSILLGLARVPFGPYLLVSIVVPSSYAIAVITLGDALMRRDPWAMAGAGALFVVVGVILHCMRKRVRAAAPAATRAPAPD